MEWSQILLSFYIMKSLGKRLASVRFRHCLNLPSNRSRPSCTPINTTTTQHAAPNTLAHLLRVMAFPRYEVERPLLFNHRVGTVGEFKRLRDSAFNQPPCLPAPPHEPYRHTFQFWGRGIEPFRLQRLQIAAFVDVRRLTPAHLRLVKPRYSEACELRIRV